MKFVKNDGGRSKYFKGSTGDCVVRAFAIALDKDYLDTYNMFKEENKLYAETKRNKVAKQLRKEGYSPRDGVYKDVAITLLEKMGYEKSTEKKKLDDEYFKNGIFIVKTRRHFSCIINGVLNDSFDSSLTSGVFAPVTVMTATTHWRIT